MMKKLLIILAFISIKSYSQDSLLAAETDKYLDSLVKRTSMNDFRIFLYKSVSAERYDEFIQFYNLFIRSKGEQYFNDKKKKYGRGN